MEWWQAILLGLVQGLTEFLPVSSSGHLMIFKELICVSMIPVFVVGMFFKDQVESLFGENLTTVAVCLLVTAALLFFSDHFGRWFQVCPRERRNGISFLQAFVVGLGQACAVAPGLSRSGTTIAVGLISGVKRDVMAQFSFLMVLVPILGEQALDILKALSGDAVLGGGVSLTALALGFLGSTCWAISGISGTNTTMWCPKDTCACSLR